MYRYRAFLGVFMAFFFVFVWANGQAVFASEAIGMEAQLQRVKGEPASRVEVLEEVSNEPKGDSSPAAVSGMAMQLLQVKSETVEEIAISESEIERITVTSEDTESKDIKTDKQVHVAVAGSGEEKTDGASPNGCHAGLVSTWGIFAVTSLTLLRRNKRTL